MLLSALSSLPAVYLSGFAAATLALWLWHGLEHRSEVSNFAPVLVAGGLLAMVVSLASLQGAAADKLFLFARDLLLQATTAYLIRALSRNPKLFVPAVFALAVLYALLYRGVQAESLQALPATEVRIGKTPSEPAEAIPADATAADAIPLDGEAELLAVADSDAAAEALRADLAAAGYRYRAAFEVPEGATDEAAAALRRVTAVDLADDTDPASLGELLRRGEHEGYFVEANERLSVEPDAAGPRPAESQRLTGPRAEDSGLDDPEAPRQWALTAWPYAAFAKTSDALRDRLRPARLFVLDSGVDAGHPDLASHYESHDEASDRDQIGHGTHVAGIAAAVANNALGVAGWWPQGEHDLRVSSIRVINAFGFTTQRAVVQGIVDAADAGASVINLSLGGPSTDSKQRVYEEAVRYANERGAIVVVAAGNSARDARGYAPANTPGVIAVAALDDELGHAYFSNDVRGLDMAVYAPGKDIVSTLPRGGYGPFSGTSMAAPQVAGLVTVAKAINPDLTTREAYRLLRETQRVSATVDGAADRPELLDPAGFLGRIAL